LPFNGHDPARLLVAGLRRLSYACRDESRSGRYRAPVMPVIAWSMHAHGATRIRARDGEWT